MYCPLCGTPNNDNAVQCVKCGHNFQPDAVTTPPVEAPPPQWAPQPYPQQSYPPQTYGQVPPGQGGDAFGGLIPYKNSSALIAYYLAVFSLIPCFGLILGIPAFILGLKGLKFAKQHPEAKGAAHAWVGIILGGLCVLANVLVAILMAASAHSTG